MSLSKNPQIDVYFAENNIQKKQILAYAEKEHAVINTIEMKPFSMNPRLMGDLVDATGATLDELTAGKVKEVETDRTKSDWLKILCANPGLFKFPIAFVGTEARIIQTPSDIRNWQ